MLSTDGGQLSRIRLMRLEEELSQLQGNPPTRLMPLQDPPSVPLSVAVPARPSEETDLHMQLVKTIQQQHTHVTKQQETMQQMQEVILKQTATIQQLSQQLAAQSPAGPLAVAGPTRPDAPKPAGPRPQPSGGVQPSTLPHHLKRGAACLGVIRLDYDYPPAPGDIDCPESFGYDVFYRVVPGLTFEMCQAGKLTEGVEKEFVAAINWMDGRGVSGITGDCGFMMYFQRIARLHSKKPVFMSALAQLPAVTCAFNADELICVMTANGKTLAPMRSLVKDECGVDPEEKRFHIVGCEDVPGFEAVAAGGKVDVAKVTPGIVEKARKTLQENPRIRAFLLECTELPPYSDALRKAFGLPVYDAITCCDYFVSGLKDNERFGIQGWQKAWDGEQAAYQYGDNLTIQQQMALVNKVHA